MKFPSDLRSRFALRSLVAASSLGALALVGCVQPTNPCDPLSDLSEQGTTTLVGVVHDENDTPIAGVSVALSGRTETTISGDDGTFSFENLVPTIDGVEVVALPPAPALGGRVLSPALACRAVVGTIEEPAVVVRVTSPPPPPDVEIIQATDRDRVFAAFGSVGAAPDATALHREDTISYCAGNPQGEPQALAGTHSYRVQVRAAFRPWQDALISTDPRDPLSDEPLATLLADGRVARGLDEACGVAFCKHFAFVHDSLVSEPTARCAEVVGLISADDAGNEVLTRLESYGSYEVRVRAQLKSPVNLVEQQIPVEIASPEVPTNVQLALVPTTVLPVVLADSRSDSEAIEGTMNIGAIVPTGDGRFAVINRGGMMVVSTGSTVTAFNSGEAASHDDAMGLDASLTDSVGEEVAGTESGHALAVLPAGKWVRVWKRFDNANGSTRSMVDKIFVGAAEGDVQEGDAGDEPRFQFEVGNAGIDAFRGFEWLTRPEGTVDDPAYDPDDGYLLLFKRGFILAEIGSGVMGAFNAAMSGGDLPTALEWGQTSDPNGPEGAGLFGFCSQMDATGIDGEITQVCFDMQDVFGETVDLTAVEILVGERPVLPPVSVHVFADRANDRVLAVRTVELLGGALVNASPRPLVEAISSVQVGASPTALQRSAILSCEGETELVRNEVLLVTNAGSDDISILQFSGGQELVEEISVVAIDGTPTGFLGDSGGPTCEDPFVWVTTDDGQVFPIDLRVNRLDTPKCSGRACSVATRTRAPVGAVSRPVGGRSRALVGGRGVLGELGFLRPAD